MRVIAAIALLGAAFITSPASSQQVFNDTGSLKMCPDATGDEAKTFKKIPVEEPRIEERDGFKVEGADALLGAHSVASFENIPRSWATVMLFAPQMKNAVRPAAPLADGILAPPRTYAVCFDGEGESFHFIPGVEVTDLNTVRDGFTGVEIPPNKYAVFTYKGPESGTGNFRWSVGEYMKASTHTRKDAPNFEVYEPGANPMAKEIAMEFWIPIE